MQTIPPRVILHVFSSEELTEANIAQLRDKTIEILEAQGRALIDLVVDCGPPKRDAADHESLMRIARGEADGIMLMQYPLRITPKKSRDILGSQITSMFPLVLSAAELAERGLLPGGTVFLPQRPVGDAAKRASELRTEGLSLSAIAQTLTAEGYRTVNGGKWHAQTVANLLQRSHVDPNQPSTEPSHAH